jgi:hypothetical protein
MRTAPPLIPEEFETLRQLISHCFQEAARELPWQDALILKACEQGLAFALFGGMLASAWRLEEVSNTLGTTEQRERLEHTRRTLERLTFTPWVRPGELLSRLFREPVSQRHT